MKLSQMIWSIALLCPFTSTLADERHAHDTRYFVDGLFGQAAQDNALAGFPTISGKAKSRGIRGGFYISRHLALELGRQQYGDADETFVDSFGDSVTTTLDTSAYTVGLRGEIPLGRRMSVTGRVGWAAWDFQLRDTYAGFSNPSFRDDDSGIDSYTGIGLQFKPEENFYLSVEYSTLEFRAAIDGAGTEHDIRNFAVSAGFTF